MVKKTVCAVLVILMVFAAPLTAFAADEGADVRLKFDENGDFNILHLTDWHCDYPLPAVHKQLVLESIAEAKPDLVVLGGDLSEAAHEDQPAAIKEICGIFAEAELPFVITFGNHDYLHGYTIDEMFAFYKEYGGEYFIGTDDLEADSTSVFRGHFNLSIDLSCSGLFAQFLFASLAGSG